MEYTTCDNWQMIYSLINLSKAPFCKREQSIPKVLLQELNIVGVIFSSLLSLFKKIWSRKKKHVNDYPQWLFLMYKFNV